MENEPMDATIKSPPRQLDAKLKQAERTANAAHAFATAESTADVIRVSMDLDKIILELGRLHDAAATI